MTKIEQLMRFAIHDVVSDNILDIILQEHE